MWEPIWTGLARRSAAGIEISGAVGAWSPRYPSARLLVVEGVDVRGWVELTGEPTAARVAAAADRLGPRSGSPTAVAGAPGPGGPDGAIGPGGLDGAPLTVVDETPLTVVDETPLTVVVCTRERPQHLRRGLDRLADAVAAGAAHGPATVLVVDNAPVSDATAEVVAAAAAAGTPVERVVAPVPGLSRARNVGLRAATTPLVAFTDDDVLVDREWLVGLRRGFARSDAVALVTGLVPSAELDTDVQARFDRQVRWSSRLDPARWRLAPDQPRPGSFPYAAGQFGTGASMAVRRQIALDLGGFDERLGAGTRSRGGEDLEMFVRVLRAGHELAYEPAAIAWHVHRREAEAYRRQVFSYGAGLGAYVTALLHQPGRGALAVGASRAAVELARARRRGAGPGDAGASGNGPGGAGPGRREGAGYLEVAGLLWGPPAYLSERWRERRADTVGADA